MFELLLVVMGILVVFWAGYYWRKREEKKLQISAEKYIEICTANFNKEKKKLDEQEKELLSKANKFEDDRQRYERILASRESVIQEKEIIIKRIEEKEKILSARIADIPVLSEIVSSIESRRISMAKEYLLYKKRAVKAAEVISDMQGKIDKYASDAITYYNRLRVYETLFSPIIESIQEQKISSISPEYINNIQNTSKFFLIIRKEEENLKKKQDA